MSRTIFTAQLLWFLKPLLLTIVIESGIALLLGIRQSRFYLAMLWINAMTNPLLCLTVLFLYRFGIAHVGGIVFLCELLIVFVEWRLLLLVFPSQKRKMFFLSLILNSGSYLFGLCLNAIARM